MSRNNCIQAECEADTLLLEVLGFKKPGHQQGMFNVIKAFEKYPGVQIIGVIDRDKKQPALIQRLVEIKGYSDIILLQHPIQRVHSLITHPNLEDWLYEKESKLNGIDPAQFGFKSKSYFHEVAKSKDALKNQDLRRFFNALKQKSATLQTLKSWLEELVI